MINSVSSIFSSKVCIDIHHQLNKPSFLIVIEDGIKSAIRRLHLENLPSRSYAVSLDTPTSKFSEEEKIQFSRLNHYLDKSNGTGINKRCDLVLFTEMDGIETVYIFDLKSADPDPDAACLQLMNSEIYIKYILELANVFYKKDMSNVKIFKVIGTTRVRKQVSYADTQQREKILRKKTLFNQYNVREICILPEKDYKAFLNFNEIVRLF